MSSILRAYRLWSHDFELISTRETTELEDLGGEVRYDFAFNVSHAHTETYRVILKAIRTIVG